MKLPPSTAGVEIALSLCIVMLSSAFPMHSSSTAPSHYAARESEPEFYIANRAHWKIDKTRHEATV